MLRKCISGLCSIVFLGQHALCSFIICIPSHAVPSCSNALIALLRCAPTSSFSAMQPNRAPQLRCPVTLLNHAALSYTFHHEPTSHCPITLLGHAPLSCSSVMLLGHAGPSCSSVASL